MKKVIVILILALIVIFTSIYLNKQVISTTEKESGTKIQIAKELIKDSGSLDVCYAGFSIMATRILTNSIKNSLPDTCDPSKYMAPLTQKCNEAINEVFYDKEFSEQLIDLIAEEYADEYSKEELQQILDFYNSDVFIKFTKNKVYLTQKSQKDMTELITSVFIRKLNEKMDPVLKKLEEKKFSQLCNRPLLKIVKILIL